MKVKFQDKEINIKKIGILTGGGDCAGHNAVIYGLLKRINQANQNLPGGEKMELIGLKEGWKALTKDKDNSVELKTEDLKDSFKVCGTIIKSSRTNLFSNANLEKKAPEKAMENLKRMKIDCLIVLGGDDTLGAAGRMGKQFTFPMLGAPKTMDNDVFGTECTYGFESAVVESVHFIENIMTTARSHNRCFVIELMGRHAGWVALHAGIAGGADIVLLPEETVDVKKVIKQVEKAMAYQKYCVVVVSEGARLFDKRYPKEVSDSNEELLDKVLSDKKYALVKARHLLPKKLDSFGNEQLGGMGEYVFALLEKNTENIEFRLQNCGHAIRGGVAHIADRLLGLRFGDALFQFIKEGKFGVYPGIEADNIVANNLVDVKGGKFIPQDNQLFAMRNAVDFY
ncbi:MAG: ATP-dependent 6-phosphofructokinase [Candidatus Saganbacteria bacterium]|nr:ATP-dependent 6-phosphofructokinase [Candidatus Saganbacteria bacterium]